MTTRLESSLVDFPPLMELLPLGNTSDAAEEDVRLFNAADILSNVEFDLTPEEAELARHFIACLVKNYISSRTIGKASRSSLGGSEKTSLLEIGKKIDISKLRHEDYQNALGFGVSIRKLSLSPYIRPELEYVLKLIWSKNYREFHKLTLIDKRYKKAKFRINFKKIPLLIIALPFLLLYLYSKRPKQFTVDQIVLSFRLLTFMGALSADIWNSANQKILEIGYGRNPNLQNIMRIASAKVLKGEDFHLKIGDVEYEQKFKLLGLRGQKSNAVVDELVTMLKSASDPEGMRVTNALIVAAQQNPYAANHYITVMSNREEFPKAIDEISMVEDILSNVSKPALNAMLEEMSPSPNARDYRSRQATAKRLLSYIVGLEPDAEMCLISAIVDVENFRRSTAALDLFSRLQKNSKIDGSDQILNYCINLINQPKYLKENINDIAFMEPIPRNFLIKTAMKSILAAPVAVQPSLLKQLINGILQWNVNNVVESVLPLGINAKDANNIVDIMLYGDLTDFEEAFYDVVTKFKDTLVRESLMRILANPDTPPALVLSDFKSSNNAERGGIYKFAESLTLMYQAQILAPGTIYDEVKSKQRDVEWFLIHPIVKTVATLFEDDKDGYLRVWENFPCAEKYFGVQSSLRNVQKMLSEADVTFQNEDEADSFGDIRKFIGSEDRTLSRNAQEFMLRTEINKESAEFIIAHLSSDDNESDDSVAFSFVKNNVIETIHNAPVARDRETIDYLLSCCRYPEKETEKDFFSRFDEMGDVHDFWVNTFIANSVLQNRFITQSDINRLIDVAENPFLPPYAKAGVISAFHKIRSATLAIAQLRKLRDFVGSTASTVALAALYSASKITEKYKPIMGVDELNYSTKILRDAFNVKGFKMQIRNMREENFSFIHHIDALNITEFVVHELYKIYS